MNAQKAALARVVLTLFAGLLFFSSWSLQAARFALPAGPRWQPVPPRAQRPSPRQKVELGKRLQAAVQDPAKIKKADVEAVRAAFGSDSSKMLELLRQSAD